MNKFKVFFTFFAFSWLLACGVGAFCPLIGSAAASEKLAWAGVILNALALPVWIWLRYLYPQKFHGDIRESNAFLAVLIGLAVALLADGQLGLPIYLVIANLFVVLLYLYHFSSVSHPSLPGINQQFPDLEEQTGENCNISDFCRERELDGAFVVFLRGSFCADSRSQLASFERLLPQLQKRNIGLLLFSAQPMSSWAKAFSRRDIPAPVELTVHQLEESSQDYPLFVARQGAPLLMYPWQSAAARPSAWLVDSEGVILWRELAANYRTPARADLLRAQWFRLVD
ncbi:peroxiredoxin family protein [Microbulbifer agarilyticus]|uniref:redoxin domain-containing protein n=1 Tax=Microbulbifer agarilyticus TaxID=260552 RepID=UPI001C9649F4|nr:redoxin domain-containing protein [Microbulbifer agarilyticus]MBY6191655.1 peroxiredoxin family protein [Microbulbifer agarilyticus]MBY6212436.1 peroxiredoxin family protein [Microbulbifer agarilyticus]